MLHLDLFKSMTASHQDRQPYIHFAAVLSCLFLKGRWMACRVPGYLVYHDASMHSSKNHTIYQSHSKTWPYFLPKRLPSAHKALIELQSAEDILPNFTYSHKSTKSASSYFGLACEIHAWSDRWIRKRADLNGSYGQKDK